MKNIEDVLTHSKLYEYLGKQVPVVVEEPKKKNTLVKIFAVIGVVAAVAGVAYAVYRYFKPDYLEDYEEDYMDDDFEDDFFDESEEA